MHGVRPLWSIAALVIAVLFTTGPIKLWPPSDAHMIARFHTSAPWFQDLETNEFSSATAKQLWIDSLDITTGRTFTEYNNSTFEVFRRNQPLSAGRYYSKGYAYRPGLDKENEVITDSLAGGTPYGYTYRHIIGDWYLYKLRGE